MKIHPQARDAIKTNIVFQGLMLILAGMILDGGMIARVVLTLSSAWLIGTIFIMARRRENPTKADLIFLRVGWFLLIFPCILAAAIWGL